MTWRHSGGKKAKRIIVAYRGIPGRQLRRGVVSLQGLVALPSVRVVVRVPLELEHDVVRDARWRVPGVLRLHRLVLAWLQLTPLQTVVLQVVHALKEQYCHRALGQEEGHGQWPGRGRKAQSHGC